MGDRWKWTIAEDGVEELGATCESALDIRKLRFERSTLPRNPVGVIHLLASVVQLPLDDLPNQFLLSLHCPTKTIDLLLCHRARRLLRECMRERRKGTKHRKIIGGASMLEEAPQV